MTIRYTPEELAAIGELSKESYENGLNDAWECARKIVCLPDNGGYISRELRGIFDESSCDYILSTNSASEAIAKIKEYEEKQKADAKIKIGDEVEHKVLWTENAWVIIGQKENGIYCAIDENGNYHTEKECYLRKTGRHFPQIAEVLKQMSEVEE